MPKTAPPIAIFSSLHGAVVPLSVALLAAALSFFFLFHVRFAKPKIALPVAGTKKDADFRCALEEGRRLYPNRAFALPTEPPIVILPHGLISKFKSAPESQLSADKEVYRRGLGRYTDLGVPMPEMYAAIKVDLTRHVRDLVPLLREEVEYAFERNLPFEDGVEWKEVTAFVLVKKVVTIMNALTFVGRPLSRDERWQDIAFNYSNDLRAAFDTLNKIRSWLRPFVHPVLLERIGFADRRRTVAKLLEPLLDCEDGQAGSKTLLYWIRRRLGQARGQDVKLLARMQLRAALASADTVSQEICNAVYDIASRSEYVPPLREELESLVKRASNGTWDMTMVRNMSKLDSFIRESTRLYTPFLVAMGRITTSPLDLDDGTEIPEGTTVYFDMHFSHNSPEIQHNTDTAIFDGFRYSKLREQEGLPNKYLLATTGADNLPFGHGTHSCPGRFFAAAEMKIILAYLLLNYDFKFASGHRPPMSYRGIAGIVDRKAKMLIRKRN